MPVLHRALQQRCDPVQKRFPWETTVFVLVPGGIPHDWRAVRNITFGDLQGFSPGHGGMNLSTGRADLWPSDASFKPQESTMSRNQSRKLIVAFAAVATLASAGLISGAANAKAPHGNGNGNHSVHGHPHPHDHVRIWRLREHRFVRPVGYAVRPVAFTARPAAEGLCNCLTKEYTQEGTVVFKDNCTKEMASAPADGAPETTSKAQSPTNFAGKTYQDYLAANAQSQATAQQPKN
jgi:hypothetical protein